MNGCKRFLLIPILLLTLLLGGCRAQSRYVRQLEPDSFCLTFYPLNDAITESYLLHTGDSIAVSAVKESGQLGITIAQAGKTPVYQSDALTVSACDFVVEISQDGTYSITVTGRMAYGSTDFTINRKETTDNNR